ncbi:hypothetical protein PO878_08605 [Iamia majanohamensis]|uniref:Uncharacterized protein n=1 Tax=Iamia majanohamensis TaxID=467976 RepID=A0AAF0BXI5_9ACTN|nr:hypothetical protein [Iamia majanohamensis]WCO68784.1 hypothetical protein PO878_08605 [Iamia majanohamensis]
MSNLRDHLEQTAEPDDDQLDLSALHERAVVRRRHLARRRAGLAVVVALLVVGGMGALTRSAPGERITASDQARATVEGEPDPSASTTSEPTTASSEPTTSAPEPSASTTTTPPASTTAAPSTTAPDVTPPPTTSPPTSTPPATVPPTAAPLRGTYSGTETYRLGTGECPDITHDLTVDVALDDGRSARLHEDYCGTHRGDRWYGEGTFSLDVDDGSGLSGTFVNSAPVGTSGVPYSLDVTDGRGALDRARGRCDLTVDLRVEAFGRQHHEGTITCWLTDDGDTGPSPVPDPRS